MKCAVIGLGQFGRAAARELSRSGAHVIAVDRDLALVERIKDQVALAVCFDTRDLQALQDHGIAGAEILVAAIGHEFEAQILTVVHAKKLGVQRVVARATTPDHVRVLEAVGADLVLNPDEEAARHLVHRLLVPRIEDYFELADGFSVAELEVPARAVGQRLDEIDLRRRFRLNLVAIKKLVAAEPPAYQFNPLPAAKDVLGAGDRLSLVGSDLDIAKFITSYSED